MMTTTAAIFATSQGPLEAFRFIYLFANHFCIYEVCHLPGAERLTESPVLDAAHDGQDTQPPPPSEHGRHALDD